MTARTRDARPEPTVRPPRSRAAARLGRAAVLPFILGVFAAAIAVAAHRYALAAAAAGTGCAVAAPFLLAAAMVQARQTRFNPWPLILAAGLLATAVTWRVLPFIGLGWARFPLLALAAWQAWRGLRAWVRHRRRADAYRRLAQVVSQVVSQSAGQQEQVLAGLAGTARAERVTAPHYGAAPNAAWNLRVTRWNRADVAQFSLRLPAHDDITTPEFLLRIKNALERRLGMHVRLHVDALRDEITGDVTDGREEEAPATLRDRAEERVKTAAGMLLKGVKVKRIDLDEDAAAPDGDGIAGAGNAIREVTISYDPTKLVTLADSRDKITQHMSTQLTGEPGRLRADWRVDYETVSFRMRREFPPLIHAPALSAERLREMFGDRMVLACAEDEDENYLGFALSRTTLPHGGVVGPTGGGKTQLLLLLVMRAVALGAEAWCADPKRIELMGLRGWPGVTKVATRVQDIVNLIDATHREMYQRIDDIAAGRKKRSDLRRLLVVIDEYFVFRMLLNTWWTAQKAATGEKGPKDHPAVGQISEILALCRSLNMNMLLGMQRPDAALFDLGARDNIGWWATMGSLSAQGAGMVWGDYHTGTDLPPDQPGLCTMTSAKGPVRAKVHYVPNPADILTGSLSSEDMDFLRSMLPPGTTWDGPLLADDPDPGFEAAAAAGEAVAVDPVEGFLFLLRMALSSRTAHLTAAPGGGQPGAEQASRYGWGPGPGGLPEPGGTFIGSVEQTRSGRRVYLYPEHAYDVAVAFAAELGESFGLDRKQLEDAMRNSGLLATEGTKEEPRYTVRRNLPGSGLPGDPRKRVWEIPEDALLGGGPAPVPAARPAALPSARDDAAVTAAGGQPHPGPGPAARTAPPAQAQPAPVPVRFRRAGDLADGARIVLAFDDGEVMAATIFGQPEDDPTAAEHPEPDGTPRVVLNYFDDNNAPGWVRVRADHPIRLEQPGTAEGRQQP
jgi:hypothetical protein